MKKRKMGRKAKWKNKRQMESQRIKWMQVDRKYRLHFVENISSLKWARISFFGVEERP
jgi:hypothetical protein